jgi:hypothetical protein
MANLNSTSASKPHHIDTEITNLTHLCAREICAMINEVRAAGRNPEKHPLGFLHLPLGANGFGTGLYLHVWTGYGSAQSSYNEEPIHTHTFEMVSRVLIGGLINDVYDVVPDPESPMMRCSIQFSDSGSVRQPVEASRAILIDSEHVRAPGIYSLRSGTFHISRPTSELLVTLMSKESVDPHARANVLVPAHQCNNAQGPKWFEQFPSGWQVIDEVLKRLSDYEN